EKRVTAQRRADRVPGEVDLREDVRVRPEADKGAAPIGSPDDGDRAVGHAPGVLLVMGPPVEVRLDHETLTEGVDDRKTNTMQATRHLVASTAELATR